MEIKGIKVKKLKGNTLLGRQMYEWDGFVGSLQGVKEYAKTSNWRKAPII